MSQSFTVGVATCHMTSGLAKCHDLHVAKGHMTPLMVGVANPVRTVFHGYSAKYSIMYSGLYPAAKH